MELFQLRLRETRKNNALTQEAMADALGIAYRSYRRYETGEAEPGLFTATAIANYLKVSLDYLTGRTDNPKINP